MPSGPPFISPDVFKDIISKITNVHGHPYQDVDTIYRDMSRLVTTWLASMEPSEIRKLYNDLGWGGEANARALHECAKKYLEEYHPELLPNAVT